MTGRWWVVFARDPHTAGVGADARSPTQQPVLLLAEQVARLGRRGTVRLTYLNRPTPETHDVASLRCTSTTLQAYAANAILIHEWPLSLLARVEYRPTVWLVSPAQRSAADTAANPTTGLADAAAPQAEAHAAFDPAASNPQSVTH